MVGRDATELENPGRGGRATNISDGITGQARPADLPSRGMQGPSGDEDDDVGNLTATACPLHRGNSRRGKPTPPTVHLMRHAGPPSGPEPQAPFHSPVRQESGAEEAVACRDGDVGELGEGL